MMTSNCAGTLTEKFDSKNTEVAYEKDGDPKVEHSRGGATERLVRQLEYGRLQLYCSQPELDYVLS
jgi:hypothetical protein